MRKLNAVLCIVISACVSASACAQDWFEFEVGVGASVYSKGPDGYWYQDAFAHKLRLEAPAFEVGLTGPIWQRNRFGVDWHAGWAWLGAVHTNALATPDDANYNAASATGCNGKCMPLAGYAGSGHAQALFVTLEPHYEFGHWRIGVEAGPALTKATWTVDVTDDQRWSASGMDFSVSSTDGWKLGAVVGASVSRGPFSVVYQHFFTKASGSNVAPPIWHSVDTLLVKYRF